MGRTTKGRKALFVWLSIFMQDLHWRYNYNTGSFDFIENNPQQAFRHLLKNVSTRTLVIDINLVKADELESYISMVIDKTIDSPIKFTNVIFDHSHDPMYDYNQKVNILNKFSGSKGLRAFLVSGRFEQNNYSNYSNLEEIDYPSWLFIFKNRTLPKLDHSQRKYKFSCLNRNPSLHRYIFYNLLKQHNLLDQMVYSFYNQCPYYGFKIDAYRFREIHNYVDPEFANYALKNLGDLPIAWNNETLGINDHSIEHPAYNETFCNIVTETSATEIFTSEKIWKPIAAGQMFLVVGSPGTNQWLKTMGFHTFDDEYDTDVDMYSRLKKIITLIEQHSDNFNDWWRLNQFHAEHNYYWFHSGNVERKIIQDLTAKLEF